VKAAQRELAALNPPSNVKVIHDPINDMRVMYAHTHCTIASFEAGHGKACPGSILEGIACGRPTISNTDSGLANVVQRTGCGVVISGTALDISLGIDRLRDSWSSYSQLARETAESQFDQNRFCADYVKLYSTITEPTSNPPRRRFGSRPQSLETLVYDQRSDKSSYRLEGVVRFRRNENESLSTSTSANSGPKSASIGNLS